MHLLSILRHTGTANHALPTFIREIQDIRGVRVVRLQGPVGMGIGEQVKQADETEASSRNLFSQSLLLDFKHATECDFSTIAYLVQQLRDRMASHAQVGIINPSTQLTAELAMSKVDALVRVFDSEEKAISELSKSVPGRTA